MWKANPTARQECLEVWLEEVEESLGVFALNVLIYVVTLLFALLFVGVGMYIFEAPSGAVDSIPSGMLWALFIFLENIEVASPITLGGGVMLAIARFLSLALLGVLIAVAGNVLKNYIYNDGIKRESLKMD